MCGLYLMYYSPIDDDSNSKCSGEHRKDITKQLPSDSDKLFPEKKGGSNFEYKEI